MFERLMESPVGPLTLRAEDGALTAILYGDHRTGRAGEDPALDQAEVELREYFAGYRKVFAVPVHLSGTAFQRKVWAALREIPYGETATYGGSPPGSGTPGPVGRWAPPTTTTPSPSWSPATGSSAPTAVLRATAGASQ